MSKIKTINLYKYDYVLKDINSEDFELKGGIYNKSTYDKEGRTLSEIKYDAQGEIEQNYSYAYNEQGAKIAERSWDESGDLIDDMEYDVDANGKTRFAYKNYLDGSKDTITYSYNDEGKLIEKAVRTDEDELELVDTFSYEGNDLVLHETRDEDGEVVFREEMILDEKGKVLETSNWNIESDSTTRVVNEYDDEGELRCVSSFSEDGKLLFKVSYERKGDMITGVSEETPDRKVLTSIEYDDKGNAVAQEERNEKGEINSRTERKFDENSNVIEAETLIDMHGLGRNQQYLLKYEYEFFE